MENQTIGAVVGIIFAVCAVLTLILAFLAALCPQEARQCNLCEEQFTTTEDVWICPACRVKLSKERDEFKKQNEEQQQSTNVRN